MGGDVATRLPALLVSVYPLGISLLFLFAMIP